MDHGVCRPNLLGRVATQANSPIYP